MCRFKVTLALGVMLVALGASAQPAAAATCSDYSNQAEAQRAADTIDADGDGIYCESLPCPCLKPGDAPSPSPSPSPPPQPRPTPKPKPKPKPKAQPLRPVRLYHDVRITSVLDGDTIRVKLANGVFTTVRLLGIDSPETKDPGTPVECGGLQA